MLTIKYNFNTTIHSLLYLLHLDLRLDLAFWILLLDSFQHHHLHRMKQTARTMLVLMQNWMIH